MKSKIKLALVALLAATVAFAAGNVLPSILPALSGRDRDVVVETLRNFSFESRNLETLFARANGDTSAPALYFRGRAEGFEAAKTFVETYGVSQ